MSVLLLCMLVGASGGTADHKNRIQLIEENHFYSKDDQLIFVQMIYWDEYSPSSHVLHVREWQMLRCVDQIPRYDPARQLYVAIWKRGDGSFYYVEARRFMVTRTYFDPEVSDRALLPIPCRRGLVTLIGDHGS